MLRIVWKLSSVIILAEISKVRLTDGTTPYNGRVEVQYNGEWGTVCDDGWDLKDAQVICRQLGFGPAVSIGGPYGKGKGAILLSDSACQGTETSISDCDHPGWYPQTHCTHIEDAGVICGVPEGRSKLPLPFGFSFLFPIWSYIYHILLQLGSY